MAESRTQRTRERAPALQAEIGRRVRELREARGQTKVAFAAATGIDRNFLGRVERGDQNVNLSTLARLALALGEPNLDRLVAGLSVDDSSLTT